MKKWFKVSKSVEYSTDFNFFYEHQLFITISGSRLSISSSIEQKCFRIKLDTFGLDLYLPQKDENGRSIIDTDFIRKEAKKIHSNLLEGKYHPEGGEFVD